MSEPSYALKLEKLAKHFHIYCVFAPAGEMHIDVYNIDKYGEPVSSSGRRYRAQSLQKAITKAYRLEFENTLDI